MDPQHAAPHARSFIDTLTKLRYGQATEDLTKELHQLPCAVNRTDPRQLQLPLRAVPDDQPIREVTHG